MNLPHRFVPLAVSGLFAVLGCSRGAAAGRDASEPPPALDMAHAREVALKAAPGKVLEEELEREDGRQIYSFDIDPQDGSGEIREVHVDPSTGSVLEVETETRRHERREKAEEEEEDDD